LAFAVSTFCPLSLGGSPAKSKVVVLGPLSSAQADRSRSLNIEHVSSANLIKQEISRRTPLGSQASRALSQEQSVPDQIILSILRRWFWARKPDAGFVLADFPATLLQAQVFDEWLEARDTTLTACATSLEATASPAVINHYRTLGVDVVDAETLFAA
jgi:adenylate kinase